MNYGYGAASPNWNEDRKDLLVLRLTELVGARGWFEGDKPYVEVDGIYRGVRIRRLTNLSQVEVERLIGKADAIYRTVMTDVE